MSIRFDSTISSSKTFHRIITKLSNSKHEKNAGQIQEILNICDNAHSDNELINKLTLNVNFDKTVLPSPTFNSMFKMCLIPTSIITSCIVGTAAHQLNLSITQQLLASGVSFASTLVCYILIGSVINPYAEAVNYLQEHIALRRVLLWNEFIRTEMVLDNAAQIANFFNRSMVFEPVMQLAHGYVREYPTIVFTFQSSTGVPGKQQPHKWMGVLIYFNQPLTCHEFRNDFPENNPTWIALQLIFASHKKWSIDLNSTGVIVIAVNDTFIIKENNDSDDHASPFARLKHTTENFNPRDIAFFDNAKRAIDALKG